MLVKVNVPRAHPGQCGSLWGHPHETEHRAKHCEAWDGHGWRPIARTACTGDSRSLFLTFQQQEAEPSLTFPPHPAFPHYSVPPTPLPLFPASHVGPDFKQTPLGLGKRHVIWEPRGLLISCTGSRRGCIWVQIPALLLCN